MKTTTYQIKEVSFQYTNLIMVADFLQTPDNLFICLN